MDRATLLERLQMAKKHVAADRLRVGNQRFIVAQLGNFQHRAPEAGRLLSIFEDLQKTNLAELDRILNELEKLGE